MSSVSKQYVREARGSSARTISTIKVSSVRNISAVRESSVSKQYVRESRGRSARKIGTIKISSVRNISAEKRGQ